MCHFVNETILKGEESKVMAKKNKNITKKLKQGQTNGADVLIRLIDALYELANSGNIIGLILFTFFTWIFTVTIRLPENDLVNFMGGMGSFFAHEKFYLLVMFILLMLCTLLKFKQDRIYKAEIQRLVEIRSKLMHGLKDDKLFAMKAHTSTGFDLMDGT